jgi:CheY-like chemotaxis protein
MKTLHPLKVLIVEDNPVTLEALTIYLETLGHQVVTAGNGLGAQVSMKAFRPDVAVVDHIMPALDGLGFVQSLRADSEYREVPAVVITALADGPELDDLGQRMKDLQPCKLLRKPFDPPSLLDVIRTMPRARGRGDSRVLRQSEVP